MITIKVTRVEGLSDLDETLRQLPKALAKNALRGVLIKRAQPLVDSMKSLVPDDPATPATTDLKGSIAVGIKLSRRQARLHRKENKDDMQFAEVFVGAGPKAHAHLTEFGTVHMRPQPWARPSWDSNKDAILEGIKDDFWTKIKKASDRYAKKLARMA